MKKINTGLVLFLSIITLGIYTIVWLIKRRTEMISAYKQVVPHWWWLVGPVLGSAAVGGLLGAALAIDATGILLFWLLVASLPLFGAAFALSIWWVWKFSKAAAYVTNGRVPAGWSLALYLITGGIFTAFLQYYFNRVLPPSELADKPAARPSGRFIALAVTVMVGCLVGSIAILATGDYTYIEPQDPAVRAYGEKADRLHDAYMACIKTLDSDYPEVTVDNETAYNQAYDACEMIRVEQNEAADKYNEHINR